MGTGGRDERSKRFHLRLALLGIGLLVAAGLAGAAEPARALDPTINRLMGGSDWYHALDVIASVNETSPDVPVVLLLGGSCAREATVSDGDWAAQVERRGGPAVQNRYAYNLGQLERLIRASKARGLRPVMLDLPRNMVVIKDRFYRPIQRYHQGCRALAGEYSIPFVNFVGAANLVDRDFYDIAHVVEPGRTKFQRLLSDKTIDLIKRYGMMPPPEETPTPEPSPTQ